MNVPTLLRRFDATLDWLTAVTPEGPLEDESQSFYSSPRPNQFRSRRRLRQKFDNNSPTIRIIHERIVKPVNEVTVGGNIQQCLSDMTFIEHEVDFQEDHQFSPQMTQRATPRRNKYTIMKRNRSNRANERPWTPDSLSSPSNSSDSFLRDDDKYIPTSQKACTKQACRETQWCGIRAAPRRRRSAPSDSSRRKDYDVSFIKDDISQISTNRKESRKLPSRERMNYILHKHHPVRLIETRDHDEECEKRQERLRRRRRKLLSVSIDVPNSDPVYSRHNTPVSKNRALTSEQVSDHIQKFGECMDPNSDLGIFAYELQNSLGTSISEEEFGVPGLVCKAHNKRNAICSTIDETANSGTLFGDEICARLTGTLATAINGVNACFYRRTAVKSRRPSSPYIMPEYSQEMRWPMTHSQLEEIWGDEISMLRLNDVVSSEDRRDGRETVAAMSPRSNREQPPQYTSAYFDYVTIKDIPFVQGTDVAVAPTCYIPTTTEPQTTMAKTKPEEPPLSSAETTPSTPCAPVTTMPVECSPQHVSTVVETQSSCTASNSDRGNKSTVQNNVESQLPGERFDSGEEDTPQCQVDDGKTIITLGISICGEKKDSETQSKLQEYWRIDPPTSTLDLDTLASSVDKTAFPSNLQESAALPKISISDISCTLQQYSKIDPPTGTVEFDPRENSVDKNVPPPNVQDAVTLQDKSNADISCDLKEAAMDNWSLSGRLVNTSKVPSETSPVHEDRHACDLQANPSDFWDGEIEFLGHSYASVSRQRSALNKYASKALHERSQFSSGASKDHTTCEKSDSMKLLDLAHLLSCSAEIERPGDQLQLQQDVDEAIDEARVNEDLLPLADEPRACASDSIGDDCQELEHIEIVHVEESIDQGDFFQSGETNGIIFAASHPGGVEYDFTLLGKEDEKNQEDTQDDLIDNSSTDESHSAKSISEPCVEDVSESSSFNVDDYPATFLGVITGKLPTFNETELFTADNASAEPADKKSYFASATTSVASEAQYVTTDTEFIGSQSEAARLQSAVKSEIKFLTNQSALSPVPANPSASSVLFFKPTINVFGGESGANDLAALTRAFSKMPDLSSGLSDREKSFRSPFESIRESYIKSKTDEHFRGPFCDNDDDSITRELSRLATSERLLREELESFQRKLARASETKTIIDLSMIDDSNGSDFSTNDGKHQWERNSDTLKYGAINDQSPHEGYRSSRYSTSSNGFTSMLDRETRFGNQCRRLASHSSPARFDSKTLRAPLTAIVRNENPSHSSQYMQQPPQSIDYTGVSDGRANAKIDLLRSRLNQKRSALRTAIDSQRIASQVDHIEQKDISHWDYAKSTILCTKLDDGKSMEASTGRSENDPFGNPGYGSGNHVNINGSSPKSVRKSTLLVIDDPGNSSSNYSNLPVKQPKCDNQFRQVNTCRNRSESGDHLTRTQGFAGEDSLEFPQIEVALSPNSLEFTTDDGLTFKGIEMSLFHSGVKSGNIPDVCFDKSDVENGISAIRKENEPVTEREESNSSGSKSSGYITLSDDSSSFRIYDSDGSRQLSRHIKAPGLIASNSTTSSLSIQEHLPVFARQEESSGSLSSRLSLPTIDSSKAEQMLVSYREAQHCRDPYSVNLFSARLTPSQSTSVASRHRLVRFDLPLLSEPQISYDISSDLDDIDAYVPKSSDVFPVPFLSSLSTGQNTRDTKADPPGCLEKDPDDYLKDDAEIKPGFAFNNSHVTNNACPSENRKNKKKGELVHEKKASSKRSQQVSSHEAPREIRISVPSKNTYLDKLKLSKDLRKSILLGHKKRSQPTLL